MKTAFKFLNTIEVYEPHDAKELVDIYRPHVAAHHTGTLHFPDENVKYLAFFFKDSSALVWPEAREALAFDTDDSSQLVLLIETLTCDPELIGGLESALRGVLNERDED